MTAQDGPTGRIVVRRADGNDLDEVVAVGREAYAVTYEGVIDHDLCELLLAKRWTRDAVIPSIRGGRMLVAEIDGRVAGLATVRTQRGQAVIWKLYVRPSSQGRGVGSALLDAIIERVQEDHDVLYLNFTLGNVRADEFCRRHGFVEDHREAQAGMPDLVWMRRELDGGDVT